MREVYQRAWISVRFLLKLLLLASTRSPKTLVWSVPSFGYAVNRSVPSLSLSQLKFNIVALWRALLSLKLLEHIVVRSCFPTTSNRLEVDLMLTVLMESWRFVASQELELFKRVQLRRGCTTASYSIVVIRVNNLHMTYTSSILGTLRLI